MNPILTEYTNKSTVHSKFPVNLKAGILPLENGDRLSRDEFEIRYHAMHHVKKAELIEGTVHMPSPVRNLHSAAHGNILAWLGYYSALTSGVHVNIEPTIRLDQKNEPQPDAVLRLDEKIGGNSRITDDDYIEGPPELIVEIALSSSSYDLHDKLKVYQKSGVKEYLVWRVYDREFNGFYLEKGKYIRIFPDSTGVIRSQIFTGLHLAVEDLLIGDMKRVLEVLQKGMEGSG